MNQQLLAGLVLCGGKSSRMGSDKGLLQKDGEYWARLAADKLATLQIPVFVSVHPSQQSDYSAIFTDDSLIPDSLPLHGPLAGLLSASQKFPHYDWLILACDLPDMSTSLLQELLQVYRQNSTYECFIFINENEPEPLCGVYKAESLRKIAELHRQNKLVRHSMKYILGLCSTHTAAIIGEATRQAFKNYNSQTDIS